MKKILFIIVLITISSYSFAESPINLGLKFGLNNSRITTDLSGYKNEDINNYLVGAFARVNIGRLYLQPELYYNSKGGDLINHNTGAVGTINSFNLKTVDLPVLAGIKIINKQDFNLRAMGGPVLSFVADKNMNIKDFNVDHFKNHYFGWQYGAGVDFFFLTVDLRVENSASKLISSPDIARAYNKCYLLSIGLKLF
jgi:hypothetical protein